MKKYYPERMLDDELDRAIEEISEELKKKRRNVGSLDEDLRALAIEKSKRQRGYYLPIHEKNMIEFELSLVKKPRKIQ